MLVDVLNWCKSKEKKSRKRGQTVVEFALCIPIFIFMCMALIDLGMYVFIESTMSHIVRSAARYGVTGQTDTVATGDWSDAVMEVAKKHNPYDNYITVNKQADSFLIQEVGSASNYPSAFPRGKKIRFRLTQDFKYITPFMKIIEGINGPIKIRVETVYQTEQ